MVLWPFGMTVISQLLAQRSTGSVKLRLEQRGVAMLREDGAAKLRLPRGSTSAILINTSGGLAGGDQQTVEAEAGPGVTLTLTTQAAERVYRSLGPAADVTVSLSAEAGATLHWLPQETILFDGSALARHINVELAADARFLAVESLILGRLERQEAIATLSLSDSWSVRQGGRLVHAERLRLGPQLPHSMATLNGAGAMATVLLIAPDAAHKLARIRAALGSGSGASAWVIGADGHQTGKLVARLLAKDGYSLRKMLIAVLSVCLGAHELPKVWTM